MRFTHRAVLLAVLASAGLAGSSLNFAHAGWNCPPGQHVAYSPVTGGSIQVGNDVQVASPLDRPVYGWVCVDDGGTLGSQSVGTATYLAHSGSTSAFQHTVICPSVSGCTQTFTGVKVFGPSSGQVGARPCVSPVVAEDLLCVSVGATPGSATVPTIELPNGSGDFCVVTALGLCAVQRATVKTGGNVATVYVDNTPVSVDVPALCVGTSRPGSVATVQQGSSC